MASFILVCAFLFICYWLNSRKRSRNTPLGLRPPNSKVALPFIGLTHLSFTDALGLWNAIKRISEDCVKQGGVTKSFFGNGTYFFITDAEDGSTLLNTCFEKYSIYSAPNVWLGEGLVTAKYSQWKRHRKLLNPGFSLRVIHGYVNLFNEESRRMVNDIHVLTGAGPFDPTLFIKNAFIRISCKSVFGTTRKHDSVILDKYVKAAEEMMDLIMKRLRKFWLQYPFTYKLSGYKRKMETLGETLNQMSDDFIQEVKATLSYKSKDMNSDDVKLQENTFKPLVSTILQHGDSFTDEEIREELSTAIAAAYDTSSNMFQAVLVLVGSFPEVQERLYQELIEVLGPDGDVTKEDLQKLVYTEAVLKECLRLYPTVPIIMRYVAEDLKLKKYTLEGGSNCMILLYGMLRSPSWGANADHFKPDRWFSSNLPNKGSGFFAFSYGKRNCIGKTNAMTSMKIFLAHFIRRYRIQADQTKLKFSLGLTLQPVAGKEISLELRDVN